MSDERWFDILAHAAELADNAGLSWRHALQQASHDAGLTDDERHRFLSWVGQQRIVD